METFRLWIEDDPEIPCFKRLAYEKVNVSLADVITRGIHPLEAETTHTTLGERFVQILNSDDLKPEEMARADFCHDISHVGYYFYFHDSSRFEETLERIKGSIYFVEELSYMELLTLARERLQKMWSHEIAHEFLIRAFPLFDKARSFVKTRDKSIKLSGYADFKRYDLGRILSLADFESEDNLIITAGIPSTNFRSIHFIKQVTDDRGLLRLTNCIEHFQLEVDFPAEDHCLHFTLLYNCQSDGEKIRFRPVLDSDPAKRVRVKEFASRWRTGQGCYCFTVDISRLGQMVQQSRCRILFPSLDYMYPRDGIASYATITRSKVTLYSVGGYMTCDTSCHKIQEALRTHGVSMTGRKEDLIEKLARLTVEVYQEKEPEMDVYFTSQKFIRVASEDESGENTFPILQECDLRNLVLTMYIMKHLRGNTILEAGYRNDTYDLLSIALALIKNEVTLKGSFLRVEELKK